MGINKILPIILPLVPQLILMFLRGTSMVSKFLLLVIMGRYLSLADIGIYGLVLGTGIIYTQAAGWGFGFHLNRYMVTADTNEKQNNFSHQWGVFFYTYIVTILFCYQLYPFISQEQLNMNEFTIWLSLFIIITEHATYEVTRLLIVTKRIIKGNIVLFIHSAGWAFPAACLLLFVPFARSLEFVLIFWFILNLSSLLIGFFWCREFISTPRLFLYNFILVPRCWIRKHIGPSLTVYFAFLANALLMYINRFTVGIFLGVDETGLFTLYWSVENAIYMLAHTGFIQTSYPSMIEVSNNVVLYKKRVTKLYKQTIYFSIISGLSLAFIAPRLFEIMEKAEAVSNLPLFYALLATVIIRLIATVAFYALYARHNDRSLMSGMLITLVLSIPFSVASILFFGLWGAALSEAFTSITMLFVLTYIYRKNIVGVVPSKP